jgi:hypothetical protein
MKYMKYMKSMKTHYPNKPHVSTRARAFCDESANNGT